uniref:Golgi apparatus membrane protein TVP15 n=2 Tax=Cajanus cajan TaxID=3821 RepID=A0A151T7N8_CAJCA|nr:hypothetical protein KK1_017643 [Cajanus cajan]
MRSDPFLTLCSCFSFVTVFSAILCCLVNLISAVRSFKHHSDVFDGIFRCYGVFLAFILALAETEWSCIYKIWQVLEYWFTRGMLQIFVAVMTRAFPDYSRERKEFILLQRIACYMLLSCGVVYAVSGIFCIGFLKRSLQKRKISREQAAKEIKEMERRREELEQLLRE